MNSGRLYELASLGVFFCGLTLALLLAFAKKQDRIANMLLGSALVTIVFKVGGLTSLLLPALGPLLYYYVRRVIYPKLRFRRKDLLRFGGALLLGFWVPVWVVLISVLVYLFLC